MIFHEWLEINVIVCDTGASENTYFDEISFACMFFLDSTKNIAPYYETSVRVPFMFIYRSVFVFIDISLVFVFFVFVVIIFF